MLTIFVLVRAVVAVVNVFFNILGLRSTGMDIQENETTDETATVAIVEVNETTETTQDQDQEPSPSLIDIFPKEIKIKKNIIKHHDLNHDVTLELTFRSPFY